ncbi:MAG: hypothetical protein ACKESB_02120 [Candidatus Hodgkinia cicadicola]
MFSNSFAWTDLRYVDWKFVEKLIGLEWLCSFKLTGKLDWGCCFEFECHSMIEFARPLIRSLRFNSVGEAANRKKIKRVKSASASRPYSAPDPLKL